MENYSYLKLLLKVEPTKNLPDWISNSYVVQFALYPIHAFGSSSPQIHIHIVGPNRLYFHVLDGFFLIPEFQSQCTERKSNWEHIVGLQM